MPKIIHLIHPLIQNWWFEENETAEVKLAEGITEVALKNGLDIDQITKIFPFILRMLKSTSPWAD
jgi:hypothetical protein